MTHHQTTDKELLELAAKAAGWTGWQSKHGYWNIESPDGVKTTCCDGWTKYDSDTGEKFQSPTFYDALLEANWNPLDDDGDALRLAVKLRLDVAVSERNKRTVCVSLKISGINMVSHGNDPDAATRRAIVLTAAELGRAAP